MSSTDQLTLQEQLKQKIDEQILDYYLSIDSQGNFLHPPGAGARGLHKTSPERIEKENEELDEFIRLAFGTAIPKKRIDPTHRAPFEFVSDLFFERVKNALGFANRNGGKTLDVAILNILDMLFKRNCEVASAGAVLDQANKQYRYFRQFLRMPWFKRFSEKYKKVTGKDFLVRSLQSWSSFANGSTQEIITGSDKGLRSPHPHKARIDEIDLIPWETLQIGLSMARGTHGIRGQNVFTSTRQKIRGSMQKLLNEAEQKGIAVYEWNIWEVVEKCPRRCFDDPEFGTCPIYAFCKGKAHHCEGFYSIDDFIDKVRLIDQETWETEWLNKKPSRSKLVYNFDNRHIMTPDRLFKKFGVGRPSPYWHRVSGMDFGTGPGHPFVYVKLCQFPSGEYMIFYEYVAEQRLLRDHAQAIKTSPFYLPSELIYADWAAQERLELKSMGIRTRQAVKEVLVGVDYVKTLLSGFAPSFEPMLYVWYECSFVIDEFTQYQWPTRADGSPDRTGLPMKRWDHSMDAIRYALYSSKGASTVRYRARTIPGI